ncbi:hypothetical protein G7046_g9820 [Stylonectria norvegica]|nr:hypothetical protein G7046_g9820 [Stylonectria norvegica]
MRLSISSSLLLLRARLVANFASYTSNVASTSVSADASAGHSVKDSILVRRNMASRSTSALKTSQLPDMLSIEAVLTFIQATCYAQGFCLNGWMRSNKSEPAMPMAELALRLRLKPLLPLFSITSSDRQVFTIQSILPTSSEGSDTTLSPSSPSFMTNTDGQVTTVVPSSAIDITTDTLIAIANSDGQVTKSLSPGTGTLPFTPSTFTIPNSQMSTVVPVLTTSIPIVAITRMAESTTLSLTADKTALNTSIVSTNSNNKDSQLTSLSSTKEPNTEFVVVTTNSDGPVTAMSPTEGTTTEFPIVSTNSNTQATTLSTTGESTTAATSDAPGVTILSDSQFTTLPPSTTDSIPHVNTLPDSQVTAVKPDETDAPSTTEPPSITTDPDDDWIQPPTRVEMRPKSTNDGYKTPYNI